MVRAGQQQNQVDNNKEREHVRRKTTFDKQQQLNFCTKMRYSQTNRAVQTQHNNHEEEDDGKESSSRHICYGFCINDEQQTGTWGEQQRGTLKGILWLYSPLVLLCWCVVLPASLATASTSCCLISAM